MAETAPGGASRRDGRPPLVVHVIHRFGIGGLENGIVNVIDRMPPERFAHAIVALTEVTAFAGRLRRSDVTLHALGKRAGQDPGMHARLWRLLRRLRPDVVHTRNLAALECQVTARLAGVRARVHGEHGWDAGDPLGTNPRHRLLRRLVDPSVHRYVAMSRDIERWLVDVIRVSPWRTTQIYNGVDVDRFAAGGARERPDLPGWSDPEALVVGTVGRLDPVKDQGTLVDACALLAAESPVIGSRLRLAIVGAGGAEAALRERVRASGLGDRVWFAGARDDVPAAMRGFDVFALPSLNEGISNTVLEAMATGLPVVATRVGGNPEVVDDGVTGLLVPARDVRALADALARYASAPELRAAHGAAGRQRVETRFSMRAMVDGYMRLYEDALSRARR
jgi:sugar transferase (PEP-CTERM/EpsH1 system associated)